MAGFATHHLWTRTATVPVAWGRLRNAALSPFHLLVSLIVCAAAMAAGQDEPAAAAAVEQLVDQSFRLRILNGRPAAENVFVNGAGPFTFLIDTGSQLNSISEKVAAQRHWQPAFAVELVSLEGAELRGGFVAARVRLGEAVAADQQFLIAPHEEMVRVASGADGVLGQEFLSQIDYQIDLRRRKLTLGSADVRGRRLPFERSHGRMVVQTSEGRLVLDSGADAVILRKAFAELDGAGSLATATGSLRVETALVDLELGSRLLRDVMAAFVPGAKSDAAEPDGLLPLSLLESVYISNSGGYVVIGGRR